MKKIALVVTLLISITSFGQIDATHYALNKKRLILAFTDFTSDANNFIATANITDATQKTAITKLVNDLKTNGLWTLFDAIYPFVGGNSTAHSYNLKNVATYQITWSGTITHNSNGVTFDGSTGFGSTGLNPLTVYGTNYCSMHSYVRSWTSGIVMGSTGNNYEWQASNLINDGAVGGASYTQATTGMLSIIRIDASNIQRVYDGNPSANVTNTFSANGNSQFFLGKYSGGLFSNANVALQAIGKNLTPAQASIFNDIVYNYETTLGRALPQKIYFYGTSIESGTGASPTSNRWTTLVATNKGLTEINNAVSGTPLEGGPVTNVIAQNMYDYYYSGGRLPVKRAQDKYIVISHMVNDCGYNDGSYTTTLYTTQYQAILTQLFTNGWNTTNIYLHGGFYENGWTSTWGGITVTPADNTRYLAFQTAAQNLAASNGLTYIDETGQYGSAQTIDNVHPNNTGHAAIASHVESVIP